MNLDDYPYSQIREALGSVVGRIALFITAMLFGSMLGGLTATRSIAGLGLGFVGFPDLILASLLSGVSFILLPALLIYLIISIRCEWPLWPTVIVCLLMWYNIHKTIRWTVYESPNAKRMMELQESLNSAMQPRN